MAIVLRKDSGVFIKLEPKDNVNLSENDVLEFFKIKDDVFVMVNKSYDKKQLEKIQQSNRAREKILRLLKTKSLSDRVEGKFENLLNKEEIAELQNMIKEGVVEKFKLGSRYKKAIYQYKETKDVSEIFERDNLSGNLNLERSKELLKVVNNPERKDIEIKESCSFLDKGFSIFSKEEDAINFSNKNRNLIDSKKIMSMKYFDGNIYFIEKKIFDEKSNILLNFLKKKGKASLDELAEVVNNKDLAKTLCVFLCEKGLILEERKEIYRYI
ncbi:MAG: hypothetical protein N3D73_00180 [Candidatus Diapherotrites archaeon]|nr:hypothetical protein [Candidatus Diapherotrites archaeon]